MGHLIWPSMGPSEPDVNRKWVGSGMRGIYKRRALAPCDFFEINWPWRIKGMNRTFSTLFMILLRCIMSEKIRSALLTQVFLGSDNLNIFSKYISLHWHKQKLIFSRIIRNFRHYDDKKPFRIFRYYSKILAWNYPFSFMQCVLGESGLS